MTKNRVNSAKKRGVQVDDISPGANKGLEMKKRPKPKPGSSPPKPRILFALSLVDNTAVRTGDIVSMTVASPKRNIQMELWAREEFADGDWEKVADLAAHNHVAMQRLVIQKLDEVVKRSKLI